MSRREVLIMVGGLLAGIAGCRRLFVTKEVHLIPDGYVGPVVIAFGEPRGQDARKSDDGTIVYEIPSSGVLWIKSERPAKALAEDHYFYVGRDGARNEIPRDGSPNVVQVFQYVLGGSGVENGKKMIPSSSIQYVVGVPASGADWVQKREALARRAIETRPAEQSR